MELQTAQLCSKRDKLQLSSSKTREMMEKLKSVKLGDEDGYLEEAQQTLQNLKDEIISLKPGTSVLILLLFYIFEQKKLSALYFFLSSIK